MSVGCKHNLALPFVIRNNHLKAFAGFCIGLVSCSGMKCECMEPEGGDYSYSSGIKQVPSTNDLSDSASEVCFLGMDIISVARNNLKTSEGIKKYLCSLLSLISL